MDLTYKEAIIPLSINSMTLPECGSFRPSARISRTMPAVCRLISAKPAAFRRLSSQLKLLGPLMSPRLRLDPNGALCASTRGGVSAGDECKCRECCR